MRMWGSVEGEVVFPPIGYGFPTFRRVSEARVSHRTPGPRCVLPGRWGRGRKWEGFCAVGRFVKSANLGQEIFTKKWPVGNCDAESYVIQYK